MADAPLPCWHDLTGPDAEEWAESDGVVIVPVAAVEQHGPHLPLGTDLTIGRGILETAIRELDDESRVRTLPPQAIGASREHTGRSGTVSLDSATCEETIYRIGRSLADSGVRRIVVHNSHGGNRSAVDRAALRLRDDVSLLVVKFHYARFPPPGDVDLPAEEWRHGLHGGAVETAMMLHLAPEQVHTDRIADFPSLGAKLAGRLKHVAPEGRAPFAWMATDLNPHGVVGDATLADAEMGRRLVVYYGRCLADVVRDALSFPLDRLAGMQGR